MDKNLRRAIVTVAVGNRVDVGKPNEEFMLGKPFSAKLNRWINSFLEYGEEASLLVYRELPYGCPEHLSVPYAFKSYAIRAAQLADFRLILWADSSVFAVRSLSPLWRRLESLGYWFAKNANWNCGQWTCDDALPILDINREEAFSIPQVVGTTFGLNLANSQGAKFFNWYRDLSISGAFCGPWVNDKHQASPDPRVLGHRHDQTAASVIANKLGMELTIQPNILSEYAGDDPETILKIER
jgi:hypothetical protein